MRSVVIVLFLMAINLIYLVRSLPASPSSAPDPFPNFKNPDCQWSQEEQALVKSKALVCQEKLGNITLPMVDESFKTNGYNDKCFFKCLFNELKFSTDDGEVIEKALLESIKTAPKLEKQRADVTAACIKSSRKMVEEEGGVKATPCKFTAILAVCLIDGDVKICDGAMP